MLAIALTGKQDALSDGNVLHGIRNNNNTAVLGSTFITVVPEPASAAMAAVEAVGAAGVARRRKR